MNPRQLAAEYRLSQWAQIVKERTDSELNVRKFYAQIRVKENVFYYWQDKLHKTAREELFKIEADLVPSSFVKLFASMQEAQCVENGTKFCR